uniref:Uncharacterized protein n=1 Tax=Avena sativa TaxID=4498 RepID=A0ACD5ZY10_AVESA
MTQQLPRRKYISGRSYASNPWLQGFSRPPPVSSSVAELLEQFLRTKSADELQNPWIDHTEPRLVIVDGLTIRKQLVGEIPLDHELGTALIRRWSQIDRETEDECPYISYKHVVKLDFSTLALAETDVVGILHIQKQFIGGEIPYPIESCQFFFVLAILEEGWTVYVWDMLGRAIHVLDPRAGTFGYSQGKKEHHELIVARLHDALFSSFTELFAGWPIQKSGWGTTFPRITDTNFSRGESAFAALHILMYYDGERLRAPLTKFSVSKTRSTATSV